MLNVRKTRMKKTFSYIFVEMEIISNLLYSNIDTGSIVLKIVTSYYPVISFLGSFSTPFN